MGFLEKLGLDRKKKEGAPIIGENKRKEEEEKQTLQNSVYFKAAIILAFLALLILLIPRYSYKDSYTYQKGEPWRGEDLTAPFTYSLMKSDEEIESEEKQIRQSTPPIFHVDQTARIEVQTQLDSLFSNINPVLEAYTEWQLSKLNQSASARNDSIRYMQQKNLSGVGLDQNGWMPLLENYKRLKIDTLTSAGEKRAPKRFIGIDIKLKLEHLVNELMNEGVINIAKGELPTSEITVRNLRNKTEKTYSVSNVRDMQEARQYAKFRLSKTFFDDLATSAYQVFSLVIEPNFIYNPAETQQRIEEALANISKTKGAVAKGEVIIRRGDIVTEERYNRLQSLSRARTENASDLQIWQKYIGDVLIILSIVSVFFMYIYLYRRPIFDDNWMIMMVLLAMSIVTSLCAFATGWESVSEYIVPMAIAPIILTIIFDSRVGLMSTFTLALLGGLIHANSFQFVVATVTASSLGVFSVRDIKNRAQFFFTTPGIIFFAYAFVLVGFTLTKVDAWDGYLNTLLFLGANALFMLFTYPLILLFEKTFRITTDFTLLELSDTNLPLLKKLMTKAPGTFHHSLQVANLAEAAAAAIGANALLCRVGALYHDIGKMERPDYFIENQAGDNEHSKLKPRMSARVIKNHVSKGVEMAEEESLPEIIIDFIRTHHGTTLIQFFYNKAMERADEEDKEHEIQEEDFRYDGPIPNSRETGILLLADCIEAASRAMKDPTYPKLETLVNRMVEERINEGQLSNAPLTFRDIHTIKQTFLKILVGIYHGRVEYPEEKEKNQLSNRQEQPEPKQEKVAQMDQTVDLPEDGEGKEDDEEKSDSKPDKGPESHVSRPLNT